MPETSTRVAFLCLLVAACDPEPTPRTHDGGAIVHLGFDRGLTAVSGSVRGPAQVDAPADAAPPERVPGVAGDAAQFGSGAKVTVDGVAAALAGDAVTLELWLRAAGHNPVRRSATYTCAALSTTVFLAYDAFKGRLRGRVTTQAGKADLRSPDGSIDEQRWHHAAVTYDGARVVLYVDGRPVAEQDLSGALETYPGIAFGVGTWHRTNQAFHGALDEIAVHDRALSQAELGAAATPPR